VSEQNTNPSSLHGDESGRPVSLNDLSVRKYADGVRRVFFPVWPEGKDWRFRLDVDREYAFACDFDRKTIVVGQRAYVEADNLRAALIAQVAHARSGPDSAEAWYAELDRTRTVAEILGKDRLALYLDLLMQRAEMNVLDIRKTVDASCLETWRSVPGLNDQSGVPGRSSDDSLEVTVMERQFTQASAASKRLGLK